MFVINCTINNTVKYKNNSALKQAAEEVTYLEGKRLEKI
jgi:hypothetical protein